MSRNKGEIKIPKPFAKIMKKLASQHFSSIFENESIMLTSRFFGVFSLQNRVLNFKPRKVVF
jgi:hypothetical protein